MNTFQSTHPSRGETRRSGNLHRERKNFNPLTPRGVRPPARLRLLNFIKFQSTHPSRGETAALLALNMWKIISIHSPLAG